MVAQIIEIQLFGSGSQVRAVEAEPSLPSFTGLSAPAIDYAWGGTRLRTCEIRLLGRKGEIITAMPIGEAVSCRYQWSPNRHTSPSTRVRDIGSRIPLSGTPH